MGEASFFDLLYQSYLTFSRPTELKDNLSNAKRQLVPFPGDAQVELVDRCHASEPLAVHRFSDNFILCYKSEQSPPSSAS